MSSLQQSSAGDQSSIKMNVSRRHQWRMIKDVMSRYVFGIGGISVIIAIVLIFFYLLYVVFPLFKPAEAKQVAHYGVPGLSIGKTLYMAMEEQAEIGVRFTDTAHVIFFNISDGTIISDTSLVIPPNTTITSFASGDPTTAVVAYGLSNGQALVLRHVYDISYPNDLRKIDPRIEYPLGDNPITLDKSGNSLVELAIQSNKENT